MNYVTYCAFNDELEKIAVFETLRVGGKALWQAIRGGKKLTPGGAGMFQAERQAATNHGQKLIQSMEQSGTKIHRARIKSPGSIAANKATALPDDILGMQAYGKSPAEAQKIIENLRRQGVAVKKVTGHTRPGYHGVNVKGVYQNTPLEMQISPSRMSNAGQIMEHSLVYKPATEAPLSNRFDRWFGKKVAPKMVQSGSWVPQFNNATVR